MFQPLICWTYKKKKTISSVWLALKYLFPRVDSPGNSDKDRVSVPGSHKHARHKKVTRSYQKGAVKGSAINRPLEVISSRPCLPGTTMPSRRTVLFSFPIKYAINVTLFMADIKLDKRQISVIIR